MRVSIINLNLEGRDAVGQSILHQLHFFRRRGDDVQIYTLHPPGDVAADVAAITRVVQPGDLIARRDLHFATTDLYIYHYPSRHALMDTIKSLDRGGVILFYHNVTPPELWAGEEERAELQAGIDGVKVLAPYADLVVTPSPYNADSLAAQHGIEPERVRVLPLAVPLTEFLPAPADANLLKQYALSGREVILFVGRMAGNKRIDVLVEALAKVKKAIPNAALLLVGDDSGNPSLRKVSSEARELATQLGVSADVTFAGRVDNLPAYYQLASLYVTASVHEGFGVPIIEAMASGVPVIASNATAHPWVVGDAGVLVEAGDAAALADEIVALIHNDQRYGELVQLGLARARDFSLERYRTEWAKIVSEVTEWLPVRPYPRPRAAAQTQSGSIGARTAGMTDPYMLGTESADMLLLDDLRQVEAAADVMLHGYAVQSHMPILGPIVAWIRRNLTSHLREPYLDKMFDKQEGFNWRVVQMLRSLAGQAIEARQGSTAALQARIATLEEQQSALQAQLDLLTASQSDEMETEPDPAEDSPPSADSSASNAGRL